MPKPQYVKMFDPWNWFIGTGIYMDDLAAEVRASLTGELLISSIILAVIAPIGLWLARGMLR